MWRFHVVSVNGLYYLGLYCDATFKRYEGVHTTNGFLPERYKHKWIAQAIADDKNLVIKRAELKDVIRKR